MKPEDFFYSKQQLERYRYAVELASKIKKYQDAGFLIFDEHKEIVTGEIFICTEFEESSWDIISIKSDGCTLILIGIEYWDDGRPWIPTKGDIVQQLGGYMAVDPKDIKTVL